MVKNLIGYTCSYIPVELLAATGFRPYRLLHGEIRFVNEGEKLVRVDACPLVKANLGYLLANKDKFVCIVGTSGCDMTRRMFDVLTSLTDIPTYLLNNPRTDKPQIFYDEIDWLVRELEILSQRKFTDELLDNEIERWETARNYCRRLNQKRAANPSLISTADFAQVCISYHRGKIGFGFNIAEKISLQPRVYLLGSPIPYEAQSVIELIEQNLRIVGDFNCGISRFLNIKIKEKDLTGIKEAYYYQTPCIYKRPNNQFYQQIESEIKELGCKGIIAWTLDYCDNYEFELKRSERIFGLPILRLRSDLSLQNTSQLKTRIDAFAEMIQ
ncbi:MAG: 2-hydroxyacyl-CoA dehydratase family protein [candidate division WOR-3 bacterium]